MGRVVRRHTIDRRRRRRAKILKIRAKIAKAKNAPEVQQLIQKLLRVHPHYPIANVSSKHK